MPLLALTMSFRDHPLEDLEATSIAATELPEALPCLLRAPEIKEVLVLSTCNRTEIYTWCGDVDEGAKQIRLFLDGMKGLPLDWTEPRFRRLEGDDVIDHVFHVAAGLDSMVLGETEIQGQLRAAYKNAAALGAVGPHLHGLFRWALEAGKRVRHATGLDRATDSFPRAALRAMEAILPGPDPKEILVVGNGKMAASTLRLLSRSGSRLGVVARRLEAAEELAASTGAFALPLHALHDASVAADAVVFATSAPQPLIGTDEIAQIIRAREGRPFVIVDLGLPRNVAPEVVALDGGKDGFYLFDIVGLDHAGFTLKGGRDTQLRDARDIVAAEAARCSTWFRSKPADAVVAAIQAQATRVAREEAAAATKKIAGLDDRQRAAVEQAISHSIRKIVHTPTVRTKEACARGDESLLQAARWLFGLEEVEAQLALEDGGR